MDEEEEKKVTKSYQKSIQDKLRNWEQEEGGELNNYDMEEYNKELGSLQLKFKDSQKLFVCPQYNKEFPKSPWSGKVQSIPHRKTVVCLHPINQSILFQKCSTNITMSCTAQQITGALEPCQI